VRGVGEGEGESAFTVKLCNSLCRGNDSNASNHVK
jgi:hypothetical protein